MVHQLQCLQVLRAEYTAGLVTEMSQHCMEYLRQSILCAADTRLESVRFFRPPHVVALPGEYECKDWTEVLRRAN
jgi:Mycotoxin biosynthesis protein UstYa